jgi:hypothetical protein
MFVLNYIREQNIFIVFLQANLMSISFPSLFVLTCSLIKAHVQFELLKVALSCTYISLLFLTLRVIWLRLGCV